MVRRPRVCVLAGPNGAGKTTSAAPLVRDELGITTFVNADAIALGLAAFDPASAAVAAGRTMLAQMRHLAAAGADFAFETTLASRSFAPWLRELREHGGYELLLVFVWLPSPELSIARVADRVRAGGHDVPEMTIRRRFARGIANFVQIYRPLVDGFWCYDNSQVSPRLVEHGRRDVLVGACSQVLATDAAMQHDHDDRTERLTTAMQAGVEQARAAHMALGLPIVIWRDGRAVWVDAETLEAVPPPPPLRGSPRG